MHIARWTGHSYTTVTSLCQSARQTVVFPPSGRNRPLSPPTPNQTTGLNSPGQRADSAPYCSWCYTVRYSTMEPSSSYFVTISYPEFAEPDHEFSTGAEDTPRQRGQQWRDTAHSGSHVLWEVDRAHQEAQEISGELFVFSI